MDHGGAHLLPSRPGVFERGVGSGAATHVPQPGGNAGAAGARQDADCRDRTVVGQYHAELSSGPVERAVEPGAVTVGSRGLSYLQQKWSDAPGDSAGE